MNAPSSLQLRLSRALCSETGRIAAKEPFQVRLEAGKTYFWCRCGLSKKQVLGQNEFFE